MLLWVIFQSKKRSEINTNEYPVHPKQYNPTSLPYMVVMNIKQLLIYAMFIYAMFN